MFICSDVARERYISVYWEDSQLFVVIKKVNGDGDLEEQVAVSYTHEEARDLLVECQSSATLHGAELTALDMIAVTGRIAEGLRNPPGSNSTQRITPEMWN